MNKDERKWHSGKTDERKAKNGFKRRRGEQVKTYREYMD